MQFRCTVRARRQTREIPDVPDPPDTQVCRGDLERDTQRAALLSRVVEARYRRHECLARGRRVVVSEFSSDDERCVICIYFFSCGRFCLLRLSPVRGRNCDAVARPKGGVAPKTAAQVLVSRWVLDATARDASNALTLSSSFLPLPLLRGCVVVGSTRALRAAGRERTRR